MCSFLIVSDYALELRESSSQLSHCQTPSILAISISISTHVSLCVDEIVSLMGLWRGLPRLDIDIEIDITAEGAFILNDRPRRVDQK